MKMRFLLSKLKSCITFISITMKDAGREYILKLIWKTPHYARQGKVVYENKTFL